MSKAAANYQPKTYTYKQLAKATQNFSRENLLGIGGFGSVYKGILSDPSLTVAVEKISANSKQGESEYMAEICTIGRLRHKNIVQLQGWCHDVDNLLLVYEYMPNGSLDGYIGKRFLDWEARYKILIGLASAMHYLHEECHNPVVHRDIKPNNVLLHIEYNAHLGDFGLARLLENDSWVTTLPAGTRGYLSPEISFTGKATPESDVYSFGMVVLELVSGRRSKGIIGFVDNLLDYVWELYGRNELTKAIDPSLEGNFEEEQVKRTLLVGLACLHPYALYRPKTRKIDIWV
ncbi:L-type lectin-domain containing receptor kinase IX.1-like [Rutidosis leptorrhynchoides]|uniref:L-type lectin-domain containing receptor kinase IX.1-like n=1 Tax=Rutidosis leptorrhynchoides TaxID=125765 RepID=UPI003A99CDDC